MKNIHHSINYIEMYAPDLSAIQKFYEKIFGWTFTSYGLEYIAFHDKNIEGGFALGAVQKGSTLVIFYSENLEKSLESVKKNGGNITEKIFSFPGGRRFEFEDIAGNGMAVWGE